MSGEPGKGVQSNEENSTLKKSDLEDLMLSTFRGPFKRLQLWVFNQRLAFRKYRETRRFSRNQRLFLSLLKDKRSGLEDVCRRHSELMARSMVMNYLDSKGTRHCRFCEATGPLRWHGEGEARFLVCNAHGDALSRGAKVVTVPTAADATATVR